MAGHHFLLVMYPAQGHLNPALQFSKRVIAFGAHVTLLITVHMHRRMNIKTTIPGLSLAPFSDGYDDGFNSIIASADEYDHYYSEFRRRGSEFVKNLILCSAQKGHPFTCLIYTLLVSWAPKVARGLNLPTVMLWIEPTTVLDILYYYFHGYGDYINNKTKEPSSSIALPGLPFSLSPCDIPSFLVSNPGVFSFVFALFEELIQMLDLETKPRVLINTFEALEPEALRIVDKLNMIPIGSLIPSAFLDGKDPADTSFGVYLLQDSNDYVEWLNSKPVSSVVYVSFGSYFEPSKSQMEEIARALLDCGRPFLWVIREKEKFQVEEKEEEQLSCKEELELRGKIMKWCSQVQVLSHPSLGCFLTHCGWNSTMEGLVSGVPMVAFPQWTDQKTNAKMIEDVWKIGVRVDHHVNEDKIVEGKEISRCLDVAMGVKGNELKRNAKKWKCLAVEAGKKGGPSEKNLRTYMDDVGQTCLG